MKGKFVGGVATSMTILCLVVGLILLNGQGRGPCRDVPSYWATASVLSTFLLPYA
jgi:hypothetical protein